MTILILIITVGAFRLPLRRPVLANGQLMTWYINVRREWGD